ncbi:DUF6750 family protein [Serratia quinivorans]|jgi:hypothetical protein|uniref:DUF6750 family protein n=1 Tax=Serratia quinivorans TaxID=137545 RepID=UPI0034C5E89D
MQLVNNAKNKMFQMMVSAHIFRTNVASRIVKLVAMLPMVLMSREAAAADNWWDSINQFSEGLSSTQPGLIKAAKAIGVVLFIIGLVMWYNKTKRGADIKGSSILIALIVGAFLVALGQFISQTGKTAGVDATVS